MLFFSNITWPQNILRPQNIQVAAWLMISLWVSNTSNKASNIKVQVPGAILSYLSVRSLKNVLHMSICTYSGRSTEVLSQLLSLDKHSIYLSLLHQISCYFVSGRCQDEFIIHLRCFKMVLGPKMTFGNEIKSSRCV